SRNSATLRRSASLARASAASRSARLTACCARSSWFSTLLAFALIEALGGEQASYRAENATSRLGCRPKCLERADRCARGDSIAGGHAVRAFERAVHQRPPPRRSPPPPPPRAGRSSASLTLSGRPSSIAPFMAAMALVASSGVLIVTKPKPRERPLSRSVTTWTDRKSV